MPRPDRPLSKKPASWWSIQFEVEGFDEVIVPSKEGVISYLCSGQIKGIGPKTAEKIYAMFGQNTLTVLDHEPEQLLAVSGMPPWSS